MLNNVTKNRKCHHHLTQRELVAFLISIFDREFYKKYETPAAITAHKTTIKNVMHVLTRITVGHSLSDHLPHCAEHPNVATIINSLPNQQKRSNQSRSSDYMEEASRVSDQSYDSPVATASKPLFTMDTNEIFL